MDFFNVVSLDSCKEIVKNNLPSCINDSTKIPIFSANGYVLAEDIISPDYFPPYTRSTVDGYAVIAKDVYCCSSSIPAFLHCKGKILMGETPDISISSGEAIKIPTGAILPNGADAVVMVENIDELDGEIAIYSPVSVGENVVLKGEELKPNSLIAKRGTKITPLLSGILASVGISKVKVYKPLNVAVISTGDELVDIETDATNGKIRDINTVLLSNLLKSNGFNVCYTARIKDDEQEFNTVLSSALSAADLVFISGGSSIGTKDLTEKVLSQGNILLHGIALKPGKPTLISKFGDKLVFGLPGNPFACMNVLQSIFLNVVKSLHDEPIKYTYAYTTINFPSSPGRTTLQPVKLDFDGEKYLATPIFLKSAHLYSALQADGYIELEEKAEGIYKGEKIKVYLF